MPGDLFWPFVYVGMHMDDTGLTDVKGNSMTLTGGAARSSTQSKFGGYSAYFDGVDDEIINTSSMAEVEEATQSFQFFCYPDTQTDTDPCVFQFRTFRIEYKPTGYSNGFVLNINGTRTPCGIHPEGSWYYLFGFETNATVTLYIDELLIGAFPTSGTVDGFFCLGSARLGTNANTAFCGYIDDFLLTKAADPPILGHTTRWEATTPTAAFYESEPDPEGEASGAMSLTSSATGIVAVNGTGSARLKFAPDMDGTINQAGIVSGRLGFTGLCAGTLGRFCFADGKLRFTGHAVGLLGRLGSASGSIRFMGAGQAKHGGSGAVAGALQFIGAATGNTPLLPVGTVAGAVRMTGNAVGVGGVVEDYCQ